MVKLSFYLGGRKVAVKTVSVVAIGNGAGQFHVGYESATGVSQVRGAHYATEQQAAFSARSPRCSSSPRTSVPARAGRRCACCSQSSTWLHYAVPLSACSTKAPDVR